MLNILSTEQGDGKSTLAEHLAAHLRETGMKVRIASWNKDFDSHQKEFLLASRLEDFVHDGEDETPLSEADVVIVEYPPLDDSSISKELLQSAELNIMVAPANRTWKETDQLLYEKSVEMAGDTPTALFLNCARPRRRADLHGPAPALHTPAQAGLSDQPVRVHGGQIIRPENP